MAYDFYLNKVLLPIAPSSLSVKIKNQNTTINLINDGEASVLKAPGLTEYSFDFLLPAQKYPFAKYLGKFKKQKYYLDKLEKWKTEKKTITLTISRTIPNGKIIVDKRGKKYVTKFKDLFDTSQKVVIDDYTIKEDAKEGFDVKVSIKLTQYKPFKTKKCDVTIQKTVPTVTTSNERPEGENQPQSGSKYTVVSGDCLWKIAKRFYGNGVEYTKIYNANSSIIEETAKAHGKSSSSNGHWIYPGTVLTIP